MEAIQVSLIRLDLDLNIIDANQQFLDFFDLKREAIINQPAETVINLFYKLQPALQQLSPHQQNSLILFIRNRIDRKTMDNSMFMFYVMIAREDNGYVIKLVNWLNWLHNINKSIESGYTFIEKFNQTTCKSKFSQISEICCFKALYPLLMHIPQKFKISPQPIYDIMHLFVKKDSDNIASKDYARNVLSRLQTAMRQELGQQHLDLVDLIKDENLLLFKHKNHIYIPKTALREDMVFPVSSDNLLESMLRII